MATKYFITFQQFGGNGRPIDHRSHADYEATASVAGHIPAVGDYVQLEPVGNPDAPRYMGRVRSRLFRYIGPDSCGVNIVVEDDGADWGALIKE